MNVEAMKQLRRVAESAPEDLLHMRRLIDRDATCGTAYCLAGHAAQDPWFLTRTSIANACNLSTGVIYWNTLAEVFDLPAAAITDLFGGLIANDTPPHGVTKAEVLWNIDELLAGREPRPYAICAWYCRAFADEWDRRYSHVTKFAADVDPASLRPMLERYRPSGPYEESAAT